MSETDLLNVIHNFDKHLNSLPNIKIFVKQLKFYALSNETISSQLKSELCSLIDGYQDILKANKFNVLFLKNTKPDRNLVGAALTILVGGVVGTYAAELAGHTLNNHTGPTNAAGSMAHDAINGTNHHNNDDTNEASISSSHDSNEVEVNDDTSEVQNN